MLNHWINVILFLIRSQHFNISFLIYQGGDSLPYQRERCRSFSMKIGIFGLPQSGKTTVFQALSGLKVEAAAGAKAAEGNRAVVKVPDARLEQLNEFYHPKKKVAATIEYVDMNAGVTKAGSPAINDALLGNLRTVDALAVVVRAFVSAEVAHINGSVDYLRDLQSLYSDLLLSDLSVIEKNLDKLERSLRAEKKQDLLLKKQVLLQCKECLEKEQPLRCLTFSASEQDLINSYQFLTQKPLMILINTGEGQDASKLLAPTEKYQKMPGTLVLAICGKMEQEIADLEPTEQKEFLQELGVQEPALNRFIAECFKLLGLIVFFTVGEDEVRAWTLPKDSKVVKAAGTIHTDLERGFIRAEVFTYHDLVEANGSEAKLKDTGKIRLEGKDYVTQDGDILNIRFNVKK